jgi:hypothetical protein
VPPQVNSGSSSVGSHLVRFYAKDADMIDEWSDFIATALSCGSSAILCVTQPHNDAILSRLQTCGLDLLAAADEGRYQVFDAVDTLAQFFADGRINEVRFNELLTGALARAAAASLERDGRVVVFGEMVALLWRDGHIEAAIEMERLCNVLMRTHTVTIRCAYPASSISGERGGVYFRRLCEEHSVVVLD